MALQGGDKVPVAALARLLLPLAPLLLVLEVPLDNVPVGRKHCGGQVNACEYCLAAHTVIGKKVGFTDGQILEVRSGRASFDAKLDALARLVKEITIKRGHPDQTLLESFFAAGWTKGNLVDAIVAIGDKMVSNYLHGTTHVPVDFPPAPALPA